MNSDTFAITYLGILKAGATVVTVNLLLNPKEVAYVLIESGVKALVYFEAFAEAVNAIKSQVPVSRSSLHRGPNRAGHTVSDFWRPPGRSPGRR